MVWLGVDLGDARVGLALSDPELSLAHPEGNLDAMGDSFRTLDAVVGFIADHSVERVVIGLPLLLNGNDGKSAKKARRWAGNLTKRLVNAAKDEQYSSLHIPDIVLVDERLTTVSAHHQLSMAKVQSRNHRAVVDQQSAVLILQSALDEYNGRREDYA